MPVQETTAQRSTNQKVIFIFVDGFGLDLPHPDNPFSRTTLPFLENLVQGKLLSDHSVEKEKLIFRGIDACLGVRGVPQSATGQTALFTGINAPKLLGYHYPAYPNEMLTEMLDSHTILKKAADAGCTATFANAYTPRYFDLVKKGELRHSATTLSVLAAKLPFRMTEDLEQGRAVYWDITNQRFRADDAFPVPVIEPEQAGKNLAGISGSFDLVLFETFTPDMIGHKKAMDDACEYLILFDRFIKGVVSATSPLTNIVISSDHGNMEDLNTGSHTLNPVFFLAYGQSAFLFKDVHDITMVSPVILDILNR